MLEIEGGMYSSSTHVTSSGSASGVVDPSREDLASDSLLVDQPLPAVMSINRMCLSDEPERIYRGQKSIEAMLKGIHKFAVRSGFTKHVPPVVVILKDPDQIPIFCVPDSDAPVAGGGCQGSPARATVLAAARWPSRTR